MKKYTEAVAPPWKVFCISPSKGGALFIGWCLFNYKSNCHGVERGRGTSRVRGGGGILFHGSYTIPPGRFYEFSTSRAHSSNETSKEAVSRVNKVVG